MTEVAKDTSDRQIARNIAVHDRSARKYDAVHGEIFNDVEQKRLHQALKTAVDAVHNGADPVSALDFGCGSGNLTRHLLELGADVTAADVSQGFLDLVQSRYGVDTLLMNGRDLSSIPNRSFDLVATYSVLHHIPDYLAACREMVRVCRRGGVVFIDHEASENVWAGDPVYERFRKEALRIDWRKYLTPMNYVHRIRRIFDPRYSNEGDIHVWPDDHIEWDRIQRTMTECGLELVISEDYLLYRKLYRRDVYDKYKEKCVDTRMAIFRRVSD